MICHFKWVSWVTVDIWYSIKPKASAVWCFLLLSRPAESFKALSPPASWRLKWKSINAGPERLKIWKLLIGSSALLIKEGPLFVKSQPNYQMSTWGRGARCWLVWRLTVCCCRGLFPAVGSQQCVQLFSVFYLLLCSHQCLFSLFYAVTVQTSSSSSPQPNILGAQTEDLGAQIDLWSKYSHFLFFHGPHTSGPVTCNDRFF